MVRISFIRDFIFGVILGIANILPAVSGATIAVVFNIYDKILYAISLKNIRKNLSFLIPLGAGCLFGIFAFSKMLEFLLREYKTLLDFAFLGLIIGSIPMIFRHAKQEKIKPHHALIFIVTLSFMLYLAFSGNGQMAGKTLTELGGMSAPLFLWLFLCSVISTIAMILPGISGSFVMLLLGAYTVALGAVAELDFLVLLPVAAGVLAGGFLGIKGIKIMLRNYPQALYFAILGLIVGSLFTIWPGLSGGAEGILSLLLMAVFAVVSFLFSRNE